MIRNEREMSLLKMLSVLPQKIREEAERVSLSYKNGIFSISEIHLRAEGVCALKFGIRTALLQSKVTEEDISEMLDKITESSPYAYRDNVRCGYISMKGGIRIGVSGSARQIDGKTLVNEISSLCIRIPTGRCDFEDELYDIYKNIDGSFLIYSSPGGGKTTALRSLAKLFGKGERKHTVVIDERSEFDRAQYRNCCVDILDGYTKREALSIAVRSMSAEVILIDELTDDLSDELCDVMHSGVRIIATIHAKSIGEIYSKKALKPLLDGGTFSCAVGIYIKNGRYTLESSKLKKTVVYV